MDKYCFYCEYWYAGKNKKPTIGKDTFEMWAIDPETAFIKLAKFLKKTNRCIINVR